MASSFRTGASQPARRGGHPMRALATGLVSPRRSGSVRNGDVTPTGRKIEPQSDLMGMQRLPHVSQGVTGRGEPRPAKLTDQPAYKRKL